MKEALVLSKAPGKRKNSWSWRLDAGDLAPRLIEESNSVELVDGQGTVVLVIPSPIAMDSAPATGKSGPSNSPLKASVSAQGKGVWKYTLTADGSWLQAKSRVFPVRIDPTFDSPASVGYSYKSDGTTFSGVTYVGNNGESPNRTWRTVFGFDYGSIPGNFVANAQIDVGFISGNGTPTAYRGEMRHANCLGYSCLGTYVTDYTVGTGWSYSNGAGVAQRLADRFKVNDRPAWMVTGDEGANYSFKAIDVGMQILYWGYPTVSPVSPANGAIGQSVRPTLQASTTNPGNREQWVSFDVASDSGFGTASIVASSGWQSARTWQVPEAVLRPGTTYYWRTRVVDDTNGHLGQSTERTSSVRSLQTNQVPFPADDATASPGTGSGLSQTLTTLTPTLQVGAVTDTDAVNDGKPMRTRFVIATGDDGKTGARVAKDAELLRRGEVNEVLWVFHESPVTGRSGPSGPLQNALKAANITRRVE